MPSVGTDRPTYVAGLSCGIGGGAAVLLVDGHVAAACRERQEITEAPPLATPTIPARALAAVLDAVGIATTDLAHVALVGDPLPPPWRSSGGRQTAARSVAQSTLQRGFARWRDQLRRTIAMMSGRAAPAAQVQIVERSRARLAQAYYPSPAADAALLSVDGPGCTVTTAMGMGIDGHVRPGRRLFSPHSLGLPYAAVTEYLGLTSEGGDASTMRLARDGGTAFRARLGALVTLRRGGRIEVDPELSRLWLLDHSAPLAPDRERRELREPWAADTDTRVTRFLAQTLGPPRVPGTPLEDRHREIAAAAQWLFEQMLLHVAEATWMDTRLSTLCLAGSCMRNTDAVRGLVGLTPFHDVWAAPTPGREGAAIGAALHVWHEVVGRPRESPSAAPVGEVGWIELDLAPHEGSTRSHVAATPSTGG